MRLQAPACFPVAERGDCEMTTNYDEVDPHSWTASAYLAFSISVLIFMVWGSWQLHSLLTQQPKTYLVKLPIQCEVTAWWPGSKAIDREFGAVQWDPKRCLRYNGLTAVNEGDFARFVVTYYQPHEAIEGMWVRAYSESIVNDPPPKMFSMGYRSQVDKDTLRVDFDRQPRLVPPTILLVLWLLTIAAVGYSGRLWWYGKKA